MQIKLDILSHRVCAFTTVFFLLIRVFFFRVVIRPPSAQAVGRETYFRHISERKGVSHE